MLTDNTPLIYAFHGNRITDIPRETRQLAFLALKVGLHPVRDTRTFQWTHRRASGLFLSRSKPDQTVIYNALANIHREFPHLRTLRAKLNSSLVLSYVKIPNSLSTLVGNLPSGRRRT